MELLLNGANIFQVGRLSFFKSAANRGSLCKLFSKGSTFVSTKPSSRLCNSFLELGVFGFSLPVDGNVGIGVFPQIQESLVGPPCSSFMTHYLLGAA
jgi:hypothetical protein